MTRLNNAEKNLLSEVSNMVDKHGFSVILNMLEILASNNAEIVGTHWEIIRRNLEASMLEIEEYSLNNEPN
jgi:hypothetical protein